MTVTRAVQQVFAVMQGNPFTVRSAVRFVSPETVVKLSRLRPQAARSRGESMVLTIGKPNFRERLMLKKNGGVAPKGVQSRAWPKKRGRK